jgi:hypothetical protein
VEPDLDDTVRAAPRPPVAPPAVDVEDTVVREAVPVVPPPLVEPPMPERRPVPVAAEPEPVAEPIAVDVPAAPKAVFRALLADGTEIPLDVPVYLGRKPSVPRIHTGPPPHLVTVRSPAKELSATHLELRVVGGAVVASDMRSTNGTVVQLPGAAPRTLIRGESAVVVPGTRIDLGEGVVIDILRPRERGE